MNSMKPEDIIPANVLGRDSIMGEIYGPGGPGGGQQQQQQAIPPGASGDVSQAARVPGQQQQAQPIPQPKGATHTAPGSDGNMHWTDGKSDLGIASLGVTK